MDLELEILKNCVEKSKQIVNKSPDYQQGFLDGWHAFAKQMLESIERRTVEATNVADNIMNYWQNLHGN